MLKCYKSEKKKCHTFMSEFYVSTSGRLKVDILSSKVYTFNSEILMFFIDKSHPLQMQLFQLIVQLSSLC